MSELERLVVLLAELVLGADAKHVGVSSSAAKAEALALLEVINTRAESTREYHRTRRGIDALERVNARKGKRDPDYAAARAATEEIA